jgi:transposase
MKRTKLTPRKDAAPSTSPLETSQQRGVARSETTRRGEDSNGERPISNTPATPIISSSLTQPDPEVPARARRRRFTADFKLKVLAEAEDCRGIGEIGQLLRKYGLYSSHLSVWRKERDAAARGGLDRKRGRKATSSDPLVRRVVELERENLDLRHQLRKAETIIDVQKKVSELLGVTLETPQKSGSGSWSR